MDFLKYLNEKLEYEINPLLEKDDKDEKDSKDDDKDDDKDEKKKDKKAGSRAYEYRSTATKTKGKAFKINYEIDYADLKDVLDISVPEISWTIPKVRKTFKTIRKYVGFADPKKDDEINGKQSNSDDEEK